jgi:hypothetical protein
MGWANSLRERRLEVSRFFEEASGTILIFYAARHRGDDSVGVKSTRNLRSSRKKKALENAPAPLWHQF